MKFFKSCFFFLCISIFFSCSQELDFDQVNTYELNASFTSALAYFDLEAATFLGLSKISEKSDVKLFNTSFVKENLSKIEFNFEVINEFNNDVNIEILLLDSKDNLLYKIDSLKIAAKNLKYSYQEDIDIVAHQEVKNFARIEIVIHLEDPILAEDIAHKRKLRFKSGLIIHLGSSL
jgi:hypothetical protein